MEQIDYKKKYEEAIERLKQWDREHSSGYVIKERDEFIFPELRESEDERMKEAIIATIHLYYGEPLEDEAKKMISWLEKKAEQKANEIYPIFRVGDYIRNKKTSDKVLIVQLDVKSKAYCYKSYNGAAEIHSDFSFSEQDEWELIGIKIIDQKPADKINQEWIPQVGDTIRKKGTTEPLYVLCKKESCGFSFVEERGYGIAGGRLSVYALEDYELVERPKTIEEAVDELFKPLIEDANKQKPAWSEEDERNASYICAALQCYYRLREDRNNTNGQEDLDKARIWLYNKLKSLRPQNKWKPSDEQMVVLNDIIINGHLSNANERILKGLQEQLKKLREEWL